MKNEDAEQERTDTERTDTQTTAADLTKFQLEVLYEIAAKGGIDYGLGIKSLLEDYLDTDVNHGRLYPNLDQLVDAGLIEKGEIDKRTNSYQLTADGRALLRRDAQRRSGIADQLQTSNQTVEREDPATASGVEGDD